MDHYARSSLNFFTASRLDRATSRRLDRAWLLARLADPRTRIVPVDDSRNLVEGGDTLRPVLLSSRDLGAPEALADAVILLGEHEEVTYFALDIGARRAALEATLPPACEFRELRDVGVLLDAERAALLAYARALTYWHARHRHCGDCGQPTVAADGGHLRICSDARCARRQFPRTDPAIIVLVTLGAPARSGERCLLGRQQGWPASLYSTIAGFVEPGETLEQAVVREVGEETGVHVGAVHYQSSQPWPFPSSLMLGFTATADGDTIVRHDGELADARWFTRAELAAALAAGSLRLPRRVSIAYRLIEDWFDAASPAPLADLARQRA
ncbi:MAG: NAD(+) diphosphatase [Gammaproteobacteria bacterium]|nr:NAD(+) diphosphatase [Gammaproteobacteria bacterium]